jgi:hypothetical protein
VRGAALALLVALGCSSPLEGDAVTEPVADWASVAGAEDLELATASGRRFRRVLAQPFVSSNVLHLHVYTILDVSDPALDELLESGRIALRANGRVHALRATRLTSAAEIEPVLPTLVRDRMNIDATGLRWDPEPARYPGTQLRQWFFRLESESGGAG